MNLLLDTHAWLWFSLGDAQLSTSARELIVDSQHQKFISPASYWEISIKISLGKYKLNVPFDQFLHTAIFGNGFHILPLLPSHAEQVAKLPFPANGHRDPFDRMLVAQAIVQGMQIVSQDGQLDSYSVGRLW